MNQNRVISAGSKKHLKGVIFGREMTVKLSNRSHSVSSKTHPCGRPLSINSKPLEEIKELLAALIKKLDAYVEEKQLNRSEARTKILEVIVQEVPHFRAQDLVEKVQKRFPSVGRSTVYRNLTVLVESGLVQEGPTAPDGQAMYELFDEEHHDHIVCLDCKNVFEFHDDSIEKKQENIAKNLGFTAKNHRHVVYASCDFLAKRSKK